MGDMVADKKKLHRWHKNVNRFS